MKHLSKMLMPIEILLMILSGALLFWLAPPLVGLFSKNDEVIALGSTVLRMVALSEPFFGFSIVMEGMMQGVGKTKAPFVYNLIGMWGIRILGTLLCTQLLAGNLISAWACMILHNLFLFLMYLICFMRGTWNPLKARSAAK